MCFCNTEYTYYFNRKVTELILLEHSHIGATVITQIKSTMLLYTLTVHNYSLKASTG